ncbi:hypothetical protein [Klebsiella aerogenes EA1509E]|nr:hypothetical protein [Klebsiella aerogenes EA1509E]
MNYPQRYKFAPAPGSSSVGDIFIDLLSHRIRQDNYALEKLCFLLWRVMVRRRNWRCKPRQF